METDHRFPSYRSLRTRALLLRWWLGASIVANFAVIGIDVIHLQVLEPGTIGPGELRSEALLHSDERVMLGAIAAIVFFVVAAALFIVWFHRAYRNINALGYRHRLGKGFAIGGWFIPLASFVLPKMIANDVWRASGRDQPEKGWTARRVSPLVHFWWAAFVMASIAGHASGQLWMDANGVDEERTAAIVDIAASGIYILAGALAIAFVKRATRRQEDHAAAIGAARPAEQAPVAGPTPVAA